MSFFCFDYSFFLFVFLWSSYCSPLSSLNRLHKTHTSVPPNIQAQSKSRKKKAVRLSQRICPWPNGRLPQRGLRWILRGTRWSDLLRCREEKKKRSEKIIRVSHIAILRRKGMEGRKTVRQMGFLILWDDLSEYISAQHRCSVYILHTHRSALNWLWTCPVSFFIHTVVYHLH